MKRKGLGAANRRHIMVLYVRPDDPVDHSVRLVLKEKNIGVEIIFVEEGECPEVVKENHPYSGDSILLLMDRDLFLYESGIIMEYLDERYPHPPLLPIEPANRAMNRLFRYRIRRDMYPLLRQIESARDDIKIAAAKRKLKDHLTTLSQMFVHQDYFMSNEFTLVDCCMAPLLWRLPRYGVNLPASARPLRNYSQRLFQRESFRSSLSEQELQYASK